MNTAEGLRRLASVIRWIGMFFVAAIVWHVARQTPHDWLVLFVGVLVLLAALMLAWVIDGFGSPPKT